METGSRKSDTHLNESSRLQQLKHFKVDGFNDGYISKFSEKSFIFNGVWRSRRDSNPRDGSPPAPLAGVCLRPLGHLSEAGVTGFGR